MEQPTNKWKSIGVTELMETQVKEQDGTLFKKPPVISSYICEED